MAPDPKSWEDIIKGKILDLIEGSKASCQELERLSTCYENIDQKVDTIIIDIAKLKVKSRILWGAIGGAIPTAIGLGIWFLKSQ